MSINYEEDKFHFQLSVDSGFLSDEQCLAESTTVMTFKLKVRGIFRYFIVYKNRKLLLAKLVKDKKVILKYDTDILEILLAIAQLNLRVNRGHAYEGLVTAFCDYLIEFINDNKK